MCAALVLGALAAPAQAAPGDIFTLAGTGAPAFGGDGGPATSAWLRQPTAVAWLADGSALVADYGNHRIRRISPSGRITTVAGTGTAGYSGDGGPATSARLNWPLDVEPTADGGFLIADLGNKRIRRVSPAGIITTVVGTGQAGTQGDGGPASKARVTSPTGVAATADGGFLVVDAAGRIRRVSPGGTISTVAGTGSPGGAGDGGPAVSAQLNVPVGIASLPDGGYVVTEWEGQRVRRVSPAGIITRVAGTGTAGFSGDGGPGTAAQINRPVGVSATSDGGILIGDSMNARVRKVSADGTITTIAGTGSHGYAGDGGPAGQAQLRSASAAAESASGAILIADNLDNRVRLIEGRSPDVVPPASVDPTAPVPARARVIRATARTVFVPITCPPTATHSCRGTIRLVLRRSARPRAAAAAAGAVVVARGKFFVRPGQTRRVRIRLTRAGRRLLRNHRQVRVRAYVARRGGPNIGEGRRQTTYRLRHRRFRHPGMRTA